MTKTDDELDEYGKRLLAPLRHAPIIDPPVAAQEKARFLSQAEQLRQRSTLESDSARQQQIRRIFAIFQGPRAKPLIRAFAVSLIVLIVLFGSSFTVSAAQRSLPGEPLYSIKSWSEDIRLSMTSSTQGKLNLILEYTNRRANEISELAASGKSLPTQASVRYQGELESALQLAAELDDNQMQNALSQIKRQAEKQGMTLEELITILPAQAEPAIMHLQQRLQEQVNLSTFGEKDPKAFRSEMRARRSSHPGTSKKTQGSDGTAPGATENSAVHQPGGSENNNGNGNQKPTEATGHGNQGSGGGNPNQGNGKNGPESTPQP